MVKSRLSAFLLATSLVSCVPQTTHQPTPSPPLPLPPPAVVTHVVTRTVVKKVEVPGQGTKIKVPANGCPADPSPPYALSEKALGTYMAELLKVADTCRATLQSLTQQKGSGP